MENKFISRITHHGYWALFWIILSQELGVPIPFPNEGFLIFAGYLVCMKRFSFPKAFFVAFAASMCGAWILYTISYGAQSLVYPHLPSFAKPIVDMFCCQISQNALIAITIGRIVPFGRGYICIAAGLSHVSPWLFACITVVADTVWNLVWIGIGIGAGNVWEAAIQRFGVIAKRIGFTLIGLVVAYFVIKYFIH